MFRKVIAVYYENHKELIITMREKNAEFLNVKTCGTYNFNKHCALKGYN
jgi:hypothetical protein